MAKRARLTQVERRWRSGAITKAARAAGKDPKRVLAALRGWETRERKQEHRARVHGERARVKTERQLSKSERAARTRDANRIESAGTYEPPRPSTRDYRADELDFIDYDGDYEDYDVETSADYEETT